MHPRLIAVPLSALFLCALSPGARAQDLPYANYLVGERALGLGGAFVGLADDPSATFHNPAGLALVSRVSVSTSFWLIAWQDRRLENGWQTAEGSASLGDDRITSPPLVVTAVARVGPVDDRGLKRHALGAAVIKPLRVDYRLDAALAGATGAGLDELATLDVVHRDNARWYGASYAYGPTRDLWSFGISGFLAQRTISHEEFELHGQDGVPAPSPEGYAIARHSLFRASMYHLVLRLGAVYAPAPKWRLGAMLQVPGVQLYGSAQSRETQYDIEATGEADARLTEHQGMSARRPIPWELRVGATYFIGRRALVTADVSVHGGTGSEDAPVRLVDAEDMPRPRFLIMETHLEPSARVALGSEWMLGERVPARVGVFGYRSGVPDVPARWDRVSASDMHTIGGSAGVGIILGDGHELSFGVAGIHSFGTGAALDQSVPDQTSYVAERGSETQVMLFMAGGRRVVKRLAKSLAKQSEEWFLR